MKSLFFPDDPVRVLEFIPAAPHSVLKLSLDTFSRRTTASLFYTNDTKVLLDITVRQLADLSAGDQVSSPLEYAPYPL